MIKYAVSYEDFDGKKVEQDLYFHLRKMDIMDLEVTEGISISERMKKIMEADSALDAKELLKGFVLSAYSVRTDDGKFLKSDNIREEFEASEAYSEFMWRLLTNPKEAADFFNNLIPKNLMEDAVKAIENQRKDIPEGEEPRDASSDSEKEDTSKALTDMSPEELEAYVQKLNEERRANQE